MNRKSAETRRKVVLIFGKLGSTDNPLAIEYLSRYCEQDSSLNQTVEFDRVTFECSERLSDVASMLVARSPFVLAGSCYVWNADATLEIVKRVKHALPEIKIILGGPEVGHVAAQILEIAPWVDYVVSGEGEEVFRQLVAGLMSNSLPDELAGVTKRSAGDIAVGRLQPAIDLSTLPSVFGHGSGEYFSSLKGKVLYETLRGCPRSCFFCDWGIASRGRVRFFPLAKIEQDLDYILQHKSVRHLYITDSEINVDDDHAKSVLNILNRLKRKHQWNGSVTFHLELSREIDSELAALICEATSGIGIGVQSFNDRALKMMGRRWFDRNQFEANVLRLERDVRFVYQFIYGCPGDDYTSFVESLRWAVEKDRDVWFDRLRVLPGTVYHQRPARFGLCFDSARPNYVISSNTFSPKDLDKADSLKRGFLLYTFRNFFRLDDLANFLGNDRIGLLEDFGNWCTAYCATETLDMARCDSPSSDFVDKIAGWIGRYILSRRDMSSEDFIALEAVMAMRANSSSDTLGFSISKSNELGDTCVGLDIGIHAREWNTKRLEE